MKRLKKVFLAVLSCIFVSTAAVGLMGCEVVVTPNNSGGFVVTPNEGVSTASEETSSDETEDSSTTDSEYEEELPEIDEDETEDETEHSEYEEELPEIDEDETEDETEHINPHDGTVCYGILTDCGWCELCGYLSENHTNHDLVGYEGPLCIDHYWDIKCKNCGYGEQRFVEGIGHSYTVEGESVEPGCENEGCSSLICEYCWSEWIIVDVVPAIGHSYTEFAETVAPTCEAEGYTAYWCSNGCGMTENRDIQPALGHKIVSHGAKEPTCTEVGWYAYETCENCSYTTYQARAKLKHSYTNYISNNDATCEENGTKTAICDNGCGKTDIITDENTAGHNWVEGTCTKCGELKSSSEGLKYTLNTEGNAYSVSGIGTCTDSILVIPSTYNDLPVMGIKERAFSQDDAITEVIIGDKVETIGEDAFFACLNLVKVVIGDSVKNMDGAVFTWCSSLVSIIVSENNLYYKAIDGNLYTKNGAILVQYCPGKADTTFEIPNTVNEIASGVFQGCELLESINIPDSVTSIGVGAFSGTAIDENQDNWVDGVLYIGKYLIGTSYQEGCSGDYTIKDGTICIADYAFNFCASLTSLTFPNSVKYIGEDVMRYDCPNVESVNISASVVSIGAGSFSGSDNLKSINVAEDNNNYQSIDGNLYTKDGSTLVKYAIGKRDTTFLIPAFVTSIGYEAFFSNEYLKSVVIGESVKTIGESAFLWSGALESVVIGNSVINIEDYAFDYCSALTSVVIGNSVRNIGYMAFYSCFCLTNVYYIGGETQWNNINIDSEWGYRSTVSGNSKLTNATRYYYSETQPTTEGNYWHYDENGEVAVW